jgi:hypothetical protein
METNTICWATFALGKVSGIAGIALGLSHHRTVGGLLLGLAFILIGTTVGLCIKKMDEVEDECEDEVYDEEDSQDSQGCR